MRDSHTFGALSEIFPFASIGRSWTVVDPSDLTRCNAGVTHGLTSDADRRDLDERAVLTQTQPDPTEPQAMAQAMSRTAGGVSNRRKVSISRNAINLTILPRTIDFSRECNKIPTIN
jgi:hypothetical protein